MKLIKWLKSRSQKKRRKYGLHFSGRRGDMREARQETPIKESRRTKGAIAHPIYEEAGEKRKKQIQVPNEAVVNIQQDLQPQPRNKTSKISKKLRRKMKKPKLFKIPKYLNIVVSLKIKNSKAKYPKPTAKLQNIISSSRKIVVFPRRMLTKPILPPISKTPNSRELKKQNVTRPNMTPLK